MFLCFMALASQANAEQGLKLTVTAAPNYDAASIIAILPGGEKSFWRPIDAALRSDFDYMTGLKLSQTPCQQANTDSPPSCGSEAVAYALKVDVNANGENIGIRYTLWDLASKRKLKAGDLTVPASQPRLAGHRIADLIQKEINGVEPMFSARLAYVMSTPAGKNVIYELRVADWDGENAQTLLASDQKIALPAWSPDRKRIAFSWWKRNRTPSIHVIELQSQKVVPLLTGEIHRHKAAAWLPDGQGLIFSLADESGSTQLYTASIGATSANRYPLPGFASIHTEITLVPAMAGHPAEVVFTSEGPGGSQIYRSPLPEPNRIIVSAPSSQSSAPATNPRKRCVAFEQQSGSASRIMVAQLDSGEITAITATGKYEMPSFTANGLFVAYVAQSSAGYSIELSPYNAQLSLGTPKTILRSTSKLSHPVWSLASSS